MKGKTVFVFVLVFLLLCGCSVHKEPGGTEPSDVQIDTKAPEDESAETKPPVTEPMETEVPTTVSPETEPSATVPSAEGMFLEKEQWAEIEALFANASTPHSRILTHFFDSPLEIDLYDVFYNGVPGNREEADQEERNWLYEKTGSDMYLMLDVVRIPAKAFGDFAESYIGISLEECSPGWEEEFIYWDKTDCYYKVSSDTNAVVISIHSVYLQDDGSYVVYYCNTMQNDKPTADFAAALVKTEDGWFIQSNVLLNESISWRYPD